MAQSVHEFVGYVIDIPSRNRAIVQLQSESSERALLFYHKLKVNGEPLPRGGSIGDFITVGTDLRFQCHAFDDTKKDKCGWYIINAWPQDDRETAPEISVRRCHGLHNCVGTIKQVTKRQGYLTYDADGTKELVMFLASHVYILGKRLSSKTDLKELFSFRRRQSIMFDAVPCDPEDNESGSSWFATAVWRGSKPQLEYDQPPPDPRTCPRRVGNITQLHEIKRLTSDPQSLFLCGQGKINKIFNSEFAIALCEIKLNQYEFILFHRSAVVLFGYCLAKTDLQTIFEEGDCIRFVAAAVPIGWPGPRWVASRVTVFALPSIKRQLELKQTAQHT